MKFTSIALTSTLTATSFGNPIPEDDNMIQKRATSCTVSAYSSVSSAKSSCTSITLSNIAVPAGKTLDLTGLKSGQVVTFAGRTTFGYKEWEGPLVSVSGTDVKIIGASGSVLDGEGSRWWDGKGGNGGKTKTKFFAAHSLKSSSIASVTIKDSPVQVFSFSSATSVTVTKPTINNKNGDTNSLGHNTDAFDIGNSDHITIDGATVYNQDDCLAINSGTNIIFTNGYCSGGHGLSIGSVGGRSNSVVDTVTISNSQIVNSDNGIRVKTVSGATGSVKGVTYSNITLNGIKKYGIVIQQDYENGSPTGTPTNGVKIDKLKLSGVTGTVTSSATNVYILCRIYLEVDLVTARPYSQGFPILQIRNASIANVTTTTNSDADPQGWNTKTLSDLPKIDSARAQLSILNSAYSYHGIFIVHDELREVPTSNVLFSRKINALDPELEGTAEDVFKVFQDFLTAHPTETVLCSIKWDYDRSGQPSDFESLLESLFNDGSHGSWYTSSTFPKLDDARGKIVLIRRYNENLGFYMDVSNNTPDHTDSTGQFRVQDIYNPSTLPDGTPNYDTKWNAVKNFLNTRQPFNSSQLNLNCLSAVKIEGINVLYKPAFWANEINARMRTWLGTIETQTANLGIVAMDFPDVPGSDWSFSVK
ncbi:uncharacterized protein DFL_002123 [Arthrobotrys flagrans]|uniref:endo-polygalacturonase n=1 Tax=Arthrobotrys flagrans TaxID=97331 RepID=A0A437AAK6_ARTFL|nr:hypothetical protein DFL_002123 [Arthrobotrys flagrans]